MYSLISFEKLSSIESVFHYYSKITKKISLKEKGLPWWKITEISVHGCLVSLFLVFVRQRVATDWAWWWSRTTHLMAAGWGRQKDRDIARQKQEGEMEREVRDNIPRTCPQDPLLSTWPHLPGSPHLQLE